MRGGIVALTAAVAVASDGGAAMAETACPGHADALGTARVLTVSAATTGDGDGGRPRHDPAVDCRSHELQHFV